MERVYRILLGIALVALAGLLLTTSLVNRAAIPAVRDESAYRAARIDLNTATLSDLTRLPGIGEKKGQAILDKRTELGGFQNVDQLLEVRGIGEGILARISPYVTVTP